VGEAVLLQQLGAQRQLKHGVPRRERRDLGPQILAERLLRQHLAAEF